MLNDPALVAVLECARHLAEMAAPIQQMQQDWNRYARDVLAPVLEAQRMAVRVAPWVRDLQATFSIFRQQQRSIADAVARMSLSLDTSGLLRDLEARQTLTEQQRAVAVSVLEDAYAAASEADIDGDLLATLEETARDFSAAETDLLPIERKTFVWFIGIVVFSLMMQAMLTSDAVAELMSDAGTVAPMAAAVMVAAGIAWDRSKGTTTNDDDQDS